MPTHDRISIVSYVYAQLDEARVTDANVTTAVPAPIRPPTSRVPSPSPVSGQFQGWHRRSHSQRGVPPCGIMHNSGS